MDVAILRLGQEDQRDHETHRRDDDRVPQAGLDVSGGGHAAAFPSGCHGRSGYAISRKAKTHLRSMGDAGLMLPNDFGRALTASHRRFR